ncbi:MAG TPA: ATP-binding protein [Asticcacaulis sp.]|nr:ATP-binding protein [Asticcacaulis sp.]
MNPVKNPFVPGAGSQPPELAGRDIILSDATIAIQRALAGKNTQSQILLGLRGVGKTVLLNQIEKIAAQNGHLTSIIEAPEDKRLVELLYPRIAQTLRKLSLIEQSKTTAYSAMRALRSFAAVFKIEFGDISISVDADPGVADSGNLEFDLAELFVKVGEAAKAAGKGWTLLIDEIQYIKVADYAALIVAVHRVNQLGLPVLFFGAGLPQVAALSGDAKSYAERLFVYPSVGALDKKSAELAIRAPVEEEGESINDNAIAAIISKTHGYPYFLQEWGYQVWNIAESSPISLGNVDQSSEKAIARLDDGFFKVRFDRLTPAEREYVCTMAKLGDGPYRSGDIADAMHRQAQRLGPMRASIIKKGMIYSPSHGDIDFTVPLFADYLRRRWLVT